MSTHSIDANSFNQQSTVTKVLESKLTTLALLVSSVVFGALAIFGGIALFANIGVGSGVAGPLLVIGTIFCGADLITAIVLRVKASNKKQDWKTKYLFDPKEKILKFYYEDEATAIQCQQEGCFLSNYHEGKLLDCTISDGFCSFTITYSQRESMYHGLKILAIHPPASGNADNWKWMNAFTNVISASAGKSKGLVSKHLGDYSSDLDRIGWAKPVQCNNSGLQAKIDYYNNYYRTYYTNLKSQYAKNGKKILDHNDLPANFDEISKLTKQDLAMQYTLNRGGKEYRMNLAKTRRRLLFEETSVLGTRNDPIWGDGLKEQGQNRLGVGHMIQRDIPIRLQFTDQELIYLLTSTARQQEGLRPVLSRVNGDLSEWNGGSNGWN